MQRREQLLRWQREHYPGSVPTGPPRHSALHWRGHLHGAWYRPRRRRARWDRVRDQCRLLWPSLCAEPNRNAGLRMRRGVLCTRSYVLHGRRLLHRTSLHLAAGVDQRHMRRRRYERRCRHRSGLRLLRPDVQRIGRLLQRCALHERHLSHPLAGKLIHPAWSRSTRGTWSA